jgi:tetratricopeptide (TPR) repeat protein
MTRLRPLFPILLLCIALPAPRARGGAGAPAREADDGATTVEARQSALADLLASARQLLEAGDAPEAARALSRAGRLQLKLNLPQDAAATYREALTLLRQTPQPSTHVDSLNGLGAAHIHLGRCDEARSVLQEAVALSEQSGYIAGKAEALLGLGECQNRDDHALALKTAQEALALWQSTDDRRGVARAYAAVGHYHLAQHNLAEAAQGYEAALNLWRELKVADKQAEALISLGFIEYRKGAWQNVLTLLADAQNLLDERAEPYRVGQITGGIADAFVESGSPEIGLDKFRQALELFRQTQRPRDVTIIVWAIGKTHYILGNYPEALENLQRALAEAEAIGEPTIVAMCNDFLGRTYAATDDPAAALRHFEVALDLYTRATNPMEAARLRALMGQVYQQQGKAGKAREHYQKALLTFKALSDQVNQSATLYALGGLELERNNLSQAEDYLRQSIEVTENMRRVSKSSDLTAAFSATIHERYEKYVECLMRQHRARPARSLDVRAFETSELARARSLAELLRATQTNLVPDLDPELARREKSLRQSLRVKEDYKVALLGKPYRPEELAALEAELARLEAEYNQVVEAIRERHPAYGQMTRPAAWDLRQIQEQVVADDETVLLEYALGADRGYVWAVTRDRVTSHELPARAQINEAARKVYKSLATRPGDSGADEFTPAARELSRLVLSPVAAELNKRRVIVVADGALHYIPFQVLPGPSADGEPLVAGHEIVNAPSASILGELRREAARRRPAAKVLAAFGNPVFASNYAQLKDAGGGGRLLALQAPGVERWQIGRAHV